MNLAKIAIENSRLTVIAIFLLAMIGVVVYLTYPSAEDPTITIRTASIEAFYPGMSAERVEALIAEPIEAAMREIAEVDEIRSSSKTGSVRVAIELHDSVNDLEPVWQDVRNKIDDLKPSLPSGTQGPVVNDEEGLTAVATIALWSDGFTMAEMLNVAEDTRDRIYTLNGVRKVQIFGAQEEHIYLEYEPLKMAGLGIPPEQIFGALSQQNIIEPGGAISASGRTITLEPTGNYDSVDEIAATVFQIPETNRVLRLDEVVNVRRGLIDPPRAPAFFNDQPAIVLSVSTLEGTNNVAFGNELTRLLDNWEQELPIGYVLDYATFQPELIETAVQGAISNVYQTLVIVLVVVMVFLGLRTGLIVGFFVPLTMLFGIIVMSLFGVELQRMSIAAMIIALGLLVDNGIVVAEDIRVRLGRGLARKDAAYQSVSTLALPLLTSSLTTIFAFLPMLLIAGPEGDYVRSLAQVVTILLLGSWLLSMTVTPAMCAWFLKAPEPGEGDVKPSGQGEKVYALYRSFLETLLKARFIALAVVLVAMVGSVQVLGQLKTEFFPLGDRNQILVYLDLEAGTDQRETQRELRKLTRWLSDGKENPEIVSNIAYVGFGGPRFFLSLTPVDPDPQRAFIVINTRSFDDVDTVLERVNAYGAAQLPAARVDAKKMWFGATEPGMVKFRLIGPDMDVLLDRGEVLINALHEVPGTVGIKQDWENKVLKLRVDIDQTRARRAGVTSRDVASSLNTAYSGMQLSDYREGDRIIPIVLRGDEDLRFSLAGVQRLQVYVPGTGQFISLGQVATVAGEWRPSQIKRLDQQRALTVEARNQVLGSPGLLEAMQEELAKLNLPAGHRLEIAGEIADQANANGKLFALVPFALAGIVVLLVGQFNSFRRGGVILATIPLVLIGGVLGLVIMGAPYGFMVLLGFFSLAGILINNGIVLIDRIREEEARTEDRREAVIQACLARLRPIVMTTLTTVLGLVPLILFGGALFYGMASVIAFGLIVGTLLTLGFVPVLYTLVMRIPVTAGSGSRSD